MDAVRRRFRPFATLRWRLMLSCFVSAFTAMMTLAVVFFVLPGVVELFSPQRPAAMAQNLQPLASRVAPLYAPLNPSALGAELGAYRDSFAIVEGLTNNTRGNVTLVPGQNAALLAVDTSGRMLADVRPGPRGGGPFAALDGAVATLPVVSNALRNQTAPDALVQVASNGLTVAAAPVVSGGVVVGALVIAADLAALVRPIYLTNLLAIAPTAALFALIASVFGAVFGILTARGLTRRIRRLAAAAGAWSEGDFSAQARDATQDELGQLARDLNTTAGRLERLLRDQQRLAVVEERNRLARELHDSVKQQLFALTMLVGGARTEVGEESDARRILDQAERVATGAQTEMTALIQALRPVGLSHRDLRVALREFCAEWGERSGIVCSVDAPAPLEMEPDTQQEIYRVVQEALANIARHSGATRVDIRAALDGATLALRIRDNGHGFDVARAAGHGLGLSSMRERIEALGGTLRITSSIGGTTIEASAPLAGALEDASGAAPAPASAKAKEERP